MTQLSLEQKLQSHSSPFEMLYNSPASPFEFPLKPTYSNWHDEQEAWRDSAIFQDMSYHMTDIVIKGPDTYKLLSKLAINSFEGFGAMQAKQFVACNYDGYIIGDGILICEEENEVSLLSRPGCLNWVKFHAEAGEYDVEVVRFDKPNSDLAARHLFRYQVQGPNADKILEKVNGGPLPDIGFFKMGKFKVGEYEVTALNHRMSGAPGYEFWGPSSQGPAVRDILLEAGEEFDLTRIGGAIFPVTAVTSGWFGGALPAIYTGDSMKSYREWLPATAPEAAGSLGGSFVTENIEDCYKTPYDLGYAFMVKFDHDFIGREALEKMAEAGAKNKKVRLTWNDEDVADIMISILSKGDRYKYMNAPVANYSMFSQDAVLLDGKHVGTSLSPVYSSVERCWISLAVIDADAAEDGKELTVVWGEPCGGSNKITVEKHIQKDVRVTVDVNPVKRD
jgi:glycine cleavage system aminomethyltransferase T